MSIHLAELMPEEIASSLGLKAFQGRQIFHWIHAKQAIDFESMTDLSKSLRQTLSEQCTASVLEKMAASTSRSQGTRKVLFRLPDGETVESVWIRDDERATICLSTQVGCAVKCAFCATGLSGFKRNLSPGEIVEQALRILEDENDWTERNPNIVYMGMGEPFRNYDATLRSIRLLMAKEGLNIGARKITVSTAGDIEGIHRFAAEGLQVRLSISLHAAEDELRSRLVPLNRKYPVDMLLNAVADYIASTSRQVTFEYTLISDVNDSLEQAQLLAKRIRPLKSTVNLIPLNPVEETGFTPPNRERCEAFQAVLTRYGIKSTLRRERGQDIHAACGQLRRQIIDAESISSAEEYHDGLA